MGTYRNLKELGTNILKRYDVVYFEELRYEVRCTYLSYCSDNNETIFKRLDIEKYGFCYKHYGYKPDVGDWPESKVDDYQALTRVVKALFEIIEKKNSQKVEEPEFKEGDRVWIISYDECKAKGIDNIHLGPEYFDTFGIIKEIKDNQRALVETKKGYKWYSIEALKPIKDYDVKVTTPSELSTDLVQTDSISIADACEAQLKMYKRVVEPNKIKVSSEFKFTVNKPKKVFF